MAKPLVLELEDDLELNLIGIICPEPDYRMAYLINSVSEFYFERADQDVRFFNKKLNAESSFALYAFPDDERRMDWYLVANKFNMQTELKSPGMFDEGGTRKTYLVHDHQQADYFLQTMDDCPSALMRSIILQLKSIPSVITAYEVDADRLKHKEYLYYLHED